MRPSLPHPGRHVRRLETRVRASIVSALLLCSPAAVRAQAAPGDPRAAISVTVGVDPVLAGQFNRPAETSGIFGTVRVLEHSSREIHGLPWRIAGELSYALRRGELLGRLAYSAAGSRGPVEFRELLYRFPPGRSAATATFGGYRAWTIEAGERWRIRRTRRVEAAVAATGGAAIVRAITIDECCEFGGAGSAFFARSLTPTASASIDLLVNVAPNVAFGVQSGVRYQHVLHADLSDLRTGPWIVEETFVGRRWSMPIAGVARLRF